MSDQGKIVVGDDVVQIMPAAFSGKVVKLAVVEGELGYLVEAKDGQQRWFVGSQLSKG